ncbi:glycosyltransferase family 4 protein [Parachryseolinea silvisoli]|uniref:glycosyltransferase family 4 protein n=1 Tax=Parachryseolinea silvisoli TaxID=2873601 RepID=UPI002265BAC0|nr:glycosyltransferase family 4 protein [Parachryseolinea silvisoli]MCD9019822.1 glycosyltransferase family 4 protein [Parachryseolinea silvisoli]
MDQKVLKRPLKVLLSIRQGQVGGGESHVLELVRGFDKSLVEPVVLSFTDGEMIDRLQAMNTPVHVIPTTTPFDVRVWGKVKRFLHNTAPDIVHAHGTRAASNLFWSTRALNLPLLYTVHGWSFHKTQPKTTYYTRLYTEKFITRQAALNICVSNSNQADGQRLFGLKNSMVIHNGVDLNKFDPTRTYPDIRQEYGVRPDEILIGYISRVTYQKNPLNFIRAMALLKNTVQNFKVLMVGDGDMKDEALALASELNLQDTIIFIKFRSDVPAILKALDIFCLPSWWEGFSIGLLEAMAMHKCVVCSSVDGNREIVSDHVTGYFFPPDNPQGMADTLAYLCQHPEARAQAAAKGETLVRQTFSAPKMIRTLEGVYQQLVRA